MKLTISDPEVGTVTWEDGELSGDVAAVNRVRLEYVRASIKEEYLGPVPSGAARDYLGNDWAVMALFKRAFPNGEVEGDVPDTSSDPPGTVY